MMTNVAQAAQMAQQLSDQQLAQALQGQHTQLPPYVAAAEAMRRQQLRQASQMQSMSAAGQDNTTVAQQLEKSLMQGGGQGGMQPTQQAGIGALMNQRPGMQPPSTPQMQQQQQNAATGYARGGLVALAGGGVPDDTSDVSPSDDELDSIRRMFGDMGQNVLGLPRRLLRDIPNSALPDWTAQPQQPRRVAIPADLGMEGGVDLPPQRTPDVYGIVPQDMGSAAPSPRTSGLLNIPPEIRKYLADTTAVTPPGSLKDYVSEREALMPKGAAYSDLENQLGEFRKTIGDRESQGGAQTMLKFASSLLASKSPYFMQAVGEAGGPTIDFYNAQQRLNQEDRMKLAQLQGSIDQARRAEAVGNVDAAEKARDKAQDLYTRMSDNARTVGGQIFGSYLQLLGHETTAAASNRNTDQLYQLRKDQLDQGNVLRRDANVSALYKQANDIMAKDPRSMTMTDEQKDKFVNDYVKKGLFQQAQVEAAIKDGGLGALPQAAGTATLQYDPATRTVKPVAQQ